MKHENTSHLALADDHHLVRSGLATMLNSMAGYEVVLEVANGKELIDKLADVPQPKIAIIDLNMPIMDGYETIQWLAANRPDIFPLALTVDASEDAMIKATRVGARGFIRKNARPDVLKTALDVLQLTGYYYTEETHLGIRQNPSMQTRNEKQRSEILAEITPRELQFLELVCHTDELTYVQIADQMGISRRTVDHFRQELFEKFHIKSKAGLVLFATKWGIVKL